ncbi:MAG: hypothetical protein ACE149_01965 [Armatimonadota bacterium]
MADRDTQVRWAPRVPKGKLRRLYEQDAQGILDAELVDEVGWMLYQRCLSILQADEARRGRVRCPGCEAPVIRPDRRDEAEVLHCDQCGWEMRWQDYARTFRRRQLNVGGAGKVFRGYAEHYERTRDPRERMLLIDGLIHAFHVMLVVWSKEPQPSRPVCPNLIDGKLSELVPFLDSLAYGDGSPPERRETRENWRRGLRAQEQFYRDIANRDRTRPWQRREGD